MQNKIFPFLLHRHSLFFFLMSVSTASYDVSYRDEHFVLIEQIPSQNCLNKKKSVFVYILNLSNNSIENGNSCLVDP